MQERRFENYLYEGETLVWRARPKENDYFTAKVISAFPFILAWLALECVAIGIAAANNIFGDLNVYYLLMSIGAVLLHLIPTGLWLMAIMAKSNEVRTVEYAITDKRVLILHSSSHDFVEWIDLKDIEEVELKRTPGEMILDTGRISLVTLDGRIVLNSVEGAKTAFKKVYRAVMADRGQKGE